jgi:O-antigen ligase
MTDDIAEMMTRPLAHPAFRRMPSRRLLKRSAWLFAIALFGYPIVGNLVSLLQIDSRIVTLPFRIAVSVFSVFVLITSGRLKSDLVHKLMFVIWLLYSFRLLHDWLGPQLEGADYAFEFFVGGCILPAVALMKSGAYDHKKYALISFGVASIGALTSLGAAVLGNAVHDLSDTSSRLFLAAVDPVSLGNLAVSAILCGLVLWRQVSNRSRFLLALIVALLLWCLILTGSKGPAFALVGCVGLWAVRRRLVWRFALLAIPVLLWVAVSSENPLVSRLASSDSDESTLERVVILNDSLQQIAAAPYVGSAFVELNSGYYPHNEFVEAALAMGVPVAVLFCFLLGVGAYRSWKTLNTRFELLGLIFFQSLFAAAVSAAIFGSVLLWVTLAMLPSASMRDRSRGDERLI